eukprot:scaffold3532_cov78-Cylindrotheca_fusiformis.AAC.2
MDCVTSDAPCGHDSRLETAASFEATYTLSCDRYGMDRSRVEGTIDGDCLEKGKYSILDMMIHRDADVVIAGRPSSYTQSLSMSLTLSRNSSERVLALPYCEINRNATLYQC